MNFAKSNPFAPPATSDQSSAAFAAESERVAFIRRTYLHLGVAILGFAGLLSVIFTALPEETLLHIAGTMTRGINWLLVLGAFMGGGWVARYWAESGGSRAKQYLGLTLFVVLEAIVFLPLLTVAQFRVGGQLIEAAGVLTLVVFGALTAVVFIGRFDFSFMRMYLMWGGIIAMGLVICAVLFGLNLGVLFAVALIALASGYILYDTSNVLHHYRTDQDVAASLALFASVALLFYYILWFLMQFTSRD